MNLICVDSLYTGNSYMGTLAKSEDPDEMQHNVAFHQGRHCLLKLKRSPEIEFYFLLEILT